LTRCERSGQNSRIIGVILIRRLLLVPIVCCPPPRGPSYIGGRGAPLPLHQGNPRAAKGGKGRPRET
jgi:hypothetical protein